MAKLRKSLAATSFLGLIALLYLFGVFATFRPRSSGMEYGELIAFALTFAGGIAALAIGYASAIFFGGKASLKIVELTTRLNKSKHALEIMEEQEAKKRKVLSDNWLVIIPALVFLLAIAIVLNIHYLNSTFSVTFQSFPSPILQGILGSLDIFTKPTSVGSLRYSVDIIPIMAFFVVVAGIVPSIVFPYLRRFKITSFNAVPFHKDILYGTLGAVFGITIGLSLIDIIYGVLVGTQPHYYSYVLPVLVGFRCTILLDFS